MKKTLLVLMFLVVGIAVVIFLFSQQDERQIRRNITSLSTAISTLMEEDGIAALAQIRKIGLLFTEDCRVVVGEPIPEIHGREALISAAYGARRMATNNEVEVVFHDVSITITEDGITAISIKTAIATGTFGREIRIIKMHWEKTEGRWKIAEAKAIPILY